MEEKHFAILRRHMVEVIAIRAELQEEELGKPAFGERVMAAMQRVPRHCFVPTQIAPLAYHARRCRSASTRRSPNPSSVH
jgi:protein-L-isoaspartate(D-aspartate) O-methyltransferase